MTIQIARRHGMAAKLCGSGSAIVMIPGFEYTEEMITELREWVSNSAVTPREMERDGFKVEKVRSHKFSVCANKHGHYT